MSKGKLFKGSKILKKGLTSFKTGYNADYETTRVKGFPFTHPHTPGCLHMATAVSFGQQAGQAGDRQGSARSA